MYDTMIHNVWYLTCVPPWSWLHTDPDSLQWQFHSTALNWLIDGPMIIELWNSTLARVKVDVLRVGVVCSTYLIK